MSIWSTPALGVDLGSSSLSAGDFQVRVLFPYGSETCPCRFKTTKQGRIEVVYGSEAAPMGFRALKGGLGKTEQVHVGEQMWSPIDFVTLLFMELKSHCQQQGIRHDRIVVSVPAGFSELGITQLQEAGRRAGLEVTNVLWDPIAVALAYGLDRVEGVKRVAVCDLGGGGCQTAVLEVGDDRIQCLALARDTQAGGEEIDTLLQDWLVTCCAETYGPQAIEVLDQACHLRLRGAAERAKIKLSIADQVEIDLPYLTCFKGQPLHFKTVLTRSEFQPMVRPLVDRWLRCLDQVFEMAGGGLLDQLILVGGSSHIPCIQAPLAEHTGMKPMMEIDPCKAVALGVSIFGYLSKPPDILLGENGYEVCSAWQLQQTPDRTCVRRVWVS